MKKLIDSLSRTKLERLYIELSLSGEQTELVEYIKQRLSRIYIINQDYKNFSSSRMIPHSKDDEIKSLELMKKFNIGDFSFLISSFSTSANRSPFFSALIQEGSQQIVTLADLDKYFFDTKHIREYEGVYNTLNYIKNRIYSVKDELIFQDYSEKKSVCQLKLGEIASYIKSIKDGTKLQLSIGNVGLTRSANGTYSHIHPYQQTMIDAVAFGTSLEKLESGNYEDCKRLLFLPRNIKNK